MLGDEYHQRLIEMLRTGEPKPLEIAYHPFSSTGVNQNVYMQKDAGQDYQQEFGKFDPQFSAQLQSEDEDEQQQPGLFGGMFKNYRSK